MHDAPTALTSDELRVVGASHLKLRERGAHDAAPAGEFTGVLLTPDLHGIATACGDPYLQIRPVSVKQAGAGTTS